MFRKPVVANTGFMKQTTDYCGIPVKQFLKLTVQGSFTFTVDFIEQKIQVMQPIPLLTNV